ncbi:zinc finger, CCHC-type containing protein [Tanacetum coccineum]
MNGNPSRVNIKQLRGRGSYALSWKPCQGDSLDLPDHRHYKHQDSKIKKAQELKTKTFAYSDIIDSSLETKLQGRVLESFQDDAKYEHVGQDIRSQDGKDDQDKQRKDLEILKSKKKSKDNDKGSRSKITEHEGISLQHNRDQRFKNSTTKQFQQDTFIRNLASGEIVSLKILKSRDAIFDENRFSSIPRPKDIIPTSDESQRDDHSNDVPSETPEPRKASAAIHNLVIHQMDVKTIFLNGDLEEEVYMKQPKGFIMPGNLIALFSLKDMGEVDVILDFSLVSTPLDPVEKLKLNTSKPVDQLEYTRAIGCLMYAMTSNRPSIAYAVGRLSRFTSNPSRQHWHAITRVFKYLKGTKNYGLSYVGYPSVLEAYSDSSWINCVEDSSFTSGWMFLLGEVPFHRLSRSKHA